MQPNIMLENIMFGCIIFFERPIVKFLNFSITLIFRQILYVLFLPEKSKSLTLLSDGRLIDAKEVVAALG